MCFQKGAHKSSSSVAEVGSGNAKTAWNEAIGVPPAGGVMLGNRYVKADTLAAESAGY